MCKLQQVKQTYYNKPGIFGCVCIYVYKWLFLGDMGGWWETKVQFGVALIKINTFKMTSTNKFVSVIKHNLPVILPWKQEIS